MYFTNGKIEQKRKCQFSCLSVPLHRMIYVYVRDGYIFIENQKNSLGLH